MRRKDCGMLGSLQISMKILELKKFFAKSIRILLFCQSRQDENGTGNTMEKLILTYETEQNVIQTKDIERLAKKYLL